MNVNGEHQFEVSEQQLWNYLMDVDVLAKITPGVSKLEILEEDKYKTVSEIKIGPVKGSFKGNLDVVEKVEPNSFAIVMEQLSKIGNAHVKVDMNITSNGDTGSALKFDGKAKLSGVIARTGQRVLSGVANKITKEVFAALEDHIEEDKKKNGVSNETVSAEPSKAHQDKVEEAHATPPSTETSEVEVSEVDRNEKVAVESTSEAIATTEKSAEVDTSPMEPEKSIVVPKDAPTGFFASIINFFKRLFN